MRCYIVGLQMQLRMRCGQRRASFGGVGVRVRHGAFTSESVPLLSRWTSRRIGVRREHGASISESVPPTVDPATRLRIRLTGVKGALTGERHLWESRAEALTLIFRDVLLWTSRRHGVRGKHWASL
jgi:hypothetical protein